MLKRLRAAVAAYTCWLHARWPAGHVEKLPEVREDGSTNVPGVYIDSLRASPVQIRER